MTRFMLANDGSGDPTLWSELGAYPLPVVSRSQFTLPSYWDDLVVAVLAGQDVDTRTAVAPGQEWDIGHPEPEGVTAVVDDCAEDGDDDSPRWGKTIRDGDWKGYKNGGKVYLTWPELVRRWGPVRRA